MRNASRSSAGLAACAVLLLLAPGGTPRAGEAVDPGDPYFRIQGGELVPLDLKDLRDPVWSKPEKGVRSTFRVYRGDRRSLSHEWQDRSSSRQEDPIAVIEGVLRIGETLWSIVKDNLPALKTDFPSISGLPKSLRSEEESDAMVWAEPQARTFGYSIKNFLGIRVVKFVYEVVYQAQGRHPTKRGLYLQNVSIRPILISVAWGFRFDVSAVANISNTGSFEEPHVQADLVLKQVVDSPLKVTHYSDSFQIRADGRMRVSR